MSREIFGVYPQPPLAAAADERGAASAPSAAAPAAGPRETILLVDDEPAVRQLFAQALTRAGYRIFEARNGQEAVKVFEEHGDGIHMLLTDLRMPYMGGAELAATLRARRKDLRLLAISGYPGSEGTPLDGDFLAKPFSRDDLLAKVREILDRK